MLSASPEEQEEVGNLLAEAMREALRERRFDPEEIRRRMLDERHAMESVTAYLDRFNPSEVYPSV